MNFAIDENVIAVANDVAKVLRGEAPTCPEADDDCRLACVDLLRRAMATDVVLLDDRDIVFSYYRRKASMSGQPGSGDAFLMALYQASYTSDRVIRVALPSKVGHGLPENFVNCGFDKDDMIYLALARAAPPAKVVNAVDTDYSEYADEISALTITIHQLCER